MSASLRTGMGVVAVALCAMVVGSAWAQQAGQDVLEIRPQQTERDAADASDRQQIGQTTQERQEYTAEFRGTQAAAGGQDQQLTQFLAACLLAKNEAEIELAQFAQKQTQNPEVREFAQMAAQDHQKIVQQLQQIAGRQTGATGREASRTDATRQLDSQQRGAADTTRLPGTPGAGQPTPGATAPGRQQALTGAGAQQGQQNEALEQLKQIDRQIVERHAESVREELQQRQGTEFDHAFVGAMIASHMQMVATLEVLEQQGPQQIQQVAQQALPTVQQHLDHAKQLKGQLGSTEGGQQRRAQAERQPRTQQPRQR